MDKSVSLIHHECTRVLQSTVVVIFLSASKCRLFRYVLNVSLLRSCCTTYGDFACRHATRVTSCQQVIFFQFSSLCFQTIIVAAKQLFAIPSAGRNHLSNIEPVPLMLCAFDRMCTLACILFQYADNQSEASILVFRFCIVLHGVFAFLY